MQNRRLFADYQETIRYWNAQNPNHSASFETMKSLNEAWEKGFKPTFIEWELWLRTQKSMDAIIIEEKTRKEDFAVIAVAFIIVMTIIVFGGMLALHFFGF